MKKIFISTALVVLFLQIAGGTRRSSVSQYGITWNFDKPYETGTFFNGDWWVVGPVIINSVSPAPTAGRNGSVVNPGTSVQGYDSRASDYNSSVLAKFPLVMQPTRSLVSTINNPATYCSDPIRTVLNTGKPRYLKTAAVLTVVDAPVAETSFRPPYIGSKKPIFKVADIRWELLPKLKPVAASPHTNMAYYERGLQRVWLDHLGFWGRECRPCDNTTVYHREIYNFLIDCALLTSLDIPNKTKLVKYLIQLGIDDAHVAMIGNGSSGQCKWPILFAGRMLGDPNISNIFMEGRNRSQFPTDYQYYYYNRTTPSLPVADRYGYPVRNQKGWTGATVLFSNDTSLETKYNVYEHVHPSKWSTLTKLSGGGCKCERYRVQNSSQYTGLEVAIYLTGITQEQWAYPAFFDYMKRWRTEDRTMINAAHLSACGETYTLGGLGNGFATQMYLVYYRPVTEIGTDFREAGRGTISSRIQVTPNPFYNHLSVSPGSHVSIYTSRGALVGKYNQRIVPTGNLEPGVYIVKAREQTQAIIKAK